VAGGNLFAGHTPGIERGRHTVRPGTSEIRCPNARIIAALLLFNSILSFF